MEAINFSVVIPVYKNEESIPRLISSLSEINKRLNGNLEVVFVVDGSPDQSFSILKSEISKLEFPAQLIAHSRNFGSFAAIRTGLSAALGEYFGVMAADLQEPPELIIEFFNSLSNDECDIAIGKRYGRDDPLISKLTSEIFWTFYRKLIVPEMPAGGVDVFGCNRNFRDQLLKLEESRSSLVALIFWLGFRRKFFSYKRCERLEGKSSWTLRKKIDYMFDSVFAFTDLPLKLLIRIGLIGSIISMLFGTIIFVAHFMGEINVPGYSAIIIMVLFFGMLNLLGLGLVGTYAWRGYENSKKRPLSITSIYFKNDKY